jgi:Protein of unknown function (DUF3253)
MAARPDTAAARKAIEDLLAGRKPGKTICPSDAARALGGDDGFRPLMGTVRDAARELAAAGRLDVTQRGEIVDLDRVKGPVRLAARGELAERQGRAGEREAGA